MAMQYQFISVNDYERQLTNVSFWCPAISDVCKRHQLALSLTNLYIRPGLPGTNPVFIVDNRVVIKFYEIHIFPSGERSFRIESDLYKWLQLPSLRTPELIACGILEDRPYIVTRIVPGASFSEAILKFKPSDRHVLAASLGRSLNYLHQISIDSHPILLQMRDEFNEFIQKQEKKCVKRHRRWHILPDHLIDQISSYLYNHEPLKAVSLIHADISCDHVMVSFDSNEKLWRATGLIDFGDAWVGDPAYELVALHCSLFDLDTDLLNTFLQAYQLERELIIERAMVAMLLFEFNIFKNVFEHRPNIFCEVTTLEELARRIWPM